MISINLGSNIITFGAGVTLPTLAIIYFFFYPAKFEKVCGMFWRAVSYIKKSADYRAIKYEVQGKINSFVSNLEARTSIPFPRIAVKWAAINEKEHIAWEDGEAIIVMRDREHRNKNFVHAAYFFTSEALLKKSKTHLSKTQKTSLDLFATQKLLEAESAASVQQFMSDYFTPEISKNDGIRGLVQQYVHIDRLGAFFPILIHELNYLGDKVFLTKPTSQVIEEVRLLINFLEQFSQREVGDVSVPEEFIGNYSRCAIKIVASKAIRERGDITVHEERISNAINRGFENVYVIGGGQNDNKQFMKKVTNAILNSFPRIQLVKNYEFGGQIIMRGSLKQVKTNLVCLRNPDAVKHLYEDNDIQAS